MLKIENLDKLKITSITAVIHFKYDNKDYFIHTNTESTTSTTLYSGRDKFRNEAIERVWGYIPNLIKYKNNRKILKAIDKRNFVKQLYKAGLIDAYNEIKEEVELEKKEYQKIIKEIGILNNKLFELKNR